MWDETYANAITGQYESQRTVALCLSTGCDDGIVEDRVLGCAWRYVVVASGNPKLNHGDRIDLDTFCGPKRLDDSGRLAAQAKAKTWLTLLGVTH